jgi:hypothetical protein
MTLWYGLHVTTYAGSIPLRLRIFISGFIGVASASICGFLLLRFHQGAGDFSWALRAARYVLNGENPYNTPLEQYPLTAAFFAVPFLWLRPELAGALFYGISSALLAFGLTRDGCGRLLIFLAFPYWAGLLTAQWPVIVMAAAFLPYLLPLTLAKPQVGLPVAITHLSSEGLLACLFVVLLTLSAMPYWPILWFRQLGNYQHFVPLLVLPGPIILLALFCYRDQSAWLLIFAAAMPQRWFFDAFILWLIPKSRPEILLSSSLSWGAAIWHWYHVAHSFTEVGRSAVIFLYLPMLVLILMRRFAPLTK